MATILAKIDFATPTTGQALLDAARSARRCFEVHGVRLMDSTLVGDGHRVLARFDAPDAESVRIVLRLTGWRAGDVCAPSHGPLKK
jgi:hypothetical protein